MVLTTFAAGEGPHARTVLLKAHDDAGFTFYTNRTSRKGRDLAADPRCCALFPWYGLGRQVTVEGVTRPLTEAESEPYYHSRPVAVPDRRVGVAAVLRCSRPAPSSMTGWRSCPRAGRRGPRCPCPISGAGT